MPKSNVAQTNTDRPSRLVRRIARFLSSWPGIAVVTFVVLASFGGVWRAFIYRSDLSRGMDELRMAYRAGRSNETRITQLDHAPLSRVRANVTPKFDSDARARAERYLINAALDDPGPESFQALGKLYLTDHRLDLAIEQFKKTEQATPRDARLQSDLGAAYLEKGKAAQASGHRGQSIIEFSTGLEHLDRAIEYDPARLEPVFNRALAYQYLGLTQSIAEWKLYLEKDPNSAWSIEARDYLRQAETNSLSLAQTPDRLFNDFMSAFAARNDADAWPIVSFNRDVSGGLIANKLIDNYLQSLSDGNPESAREQFSALEFVSELELAKANDHYVTDLVAFYRNLPDGTRQQIIRARSLMKTGNQQLSSLTPETAIDAYVEAKKIFARVKDTPELRFADYPLGHAQILTHQAELSRTTFRQVVQAAEINGYLWLESQAHNAVANVEMGQSDYSAALEHTRRSWAISERINDIVGLRKSADEFSIEYSRLGDYEQAIDWQQRGLESLHHGTPGAFQTWRSYFLMATPLYQRGSFAAAAAYQREALRVATEAKILYSICRSHIVLGLIYGGQKDYAAATKEVQLAFDLARDIPSEATRRDTLAYSSLQLGHLYRSSGDFAQAAANYDRVIQTYADTDYQAFNYAARKGKLLSCLAQGGCATVEQEIETTLGLFENYRAKILDEVNKFSFFDAEQDVYDAAIEYEYSVRHDVIKAFSYAERSRARSLLEVTRGNEKQSDPKQVPAELPMRPLEAGEIQRALTADAQLVQYAVLDHRLVIWLITRETVTSFSTEIESAALKEKVFSFVRLVTHPENSRNERVKSAGGELYQILIKPMESALDPNNQVCLIPDKSLNYLPFAALVSPVSGRYLIEEHALSLSPSATLFINSSERARSMKNDLPERILSVGNPSFDQNAYPLRDLPSAKREAEAVAGFYGTTAITGDQASKSRVLREMPNAEIVHLALHSVINEMSPLGSKLLFAHTPLSANGSADADILQASEVYRLRLPRARLVALPACQTGVDRYYAGEGMISISRPFLAIGVPLVMASLWPVDSEATMELMVSFHRHRRIDRLPTATALRQAQLDLIGKPGSPFRQPYYWAAFVVLGGYADF